MVHIHLRSPPSLVRFLMAVRAIRSIINFNHIPEKDDTDQTFFRYIESKTEDEELVMNFMEMSIEPPQGTLDPQSRIELTLKFKPVEIDPQFHNLILKNTLIRYVIIQLFITCTNSESI